MVTANRQNTKVKSKIFNEYYTENDFAEITNEENKEDFAILKNEKGTIENISLDNFTPENLIIGFLKGISHELYNYYHCLPEEIKKEKTMIIGSGNALKRNPLLFSAFEEQFDAELFLSTYQEEAAFGACLSALVGDGGKLNEELFPEIQQVPI